VPRSPCPRPRPASGVRCPVSAVRYKRPVSTRAMSTRPVSSVLCGRPGGRESAVRCGRPASGVRCPVGRPGIWVSGIRYPGVPRLLCPNRVSSSSAPMRRAATRRGRPESAWSPARYPPPAGRLPESEPDARSWRKPCWANGGIGLDLAVVVEGAWAVARSTAWPTRIGWMRGEDRLSVEATCAARSASCGRLARHVTPPAIAAQSPGNVPVREAFNGPQR
jgi:hypothetical protein